MLREPIGSERSVSEVKGAQQNHQEHFAIGMILYGNYTVRRAATRIKIPFWGFLFGEYGNLQSDGVTENILNKSSYKKSRRLAGFAFI